MKKKLLTTIITLTLAVSLTAAPAMAAAPDEDSVQEDADAAAYTTGETDAADEVDEAGTANEADTVDEADTDGETDATDTIDEADADNAACEVDTSDTAADTAALPDAGGIMTLATHSGTCGATGSESALKWTLDSAGTLTISGNGWMQNWFGTHGIVDDQKYPGWYDYRTDIKNVVVEDGVQSIGYYAFNNCSNLTSVSIADTVTINGIEDTYYKCNSLESINVPGSITTDSRFNTCKSLKTIIYNEGTTTFGGKPSLRHYAGCDSLTTMYLPNTTSILHCYDLGTLTDIYYAGTKSEWNAIEKSDSDNIAGATIHYESEQWPSKAYSGTCGSNVSWSLSGGTLTISGSGAMKDYNTTSSFFAPWSAVRDEITSVVIKSGVTSIGEKAFYKCSNLKSVTIPSSVTTICAAAFYKCSALTSITIPGTVKTIKNNAFRSCSGLKTVTLESGVSDIRPFAFWDCDKLNTVYAPSSIKYIYTDALGDCDVYYTGSESSWKSLYGDYSDICGLTMHYNYNGSSSSGSSGSSGSNKAADTSGTLKKASDGKWYYYDKNGNKDTSYNGLAANENGTYYVKNGVVDFSYTGFYGNSKGKWYVESGKVTYKKQDIIKDTSGALGDKGAWYYVIGSQVQTGFTGLSNFRNVNGWYYIKKGKVDFSHNGVDKNCNGWYYITGGKVQFGFTGLANYKNSNGWWYIKKGKVDFSHNGVDKNKNGWYYITGGKVQFGYTGVANYKNKYGWWYIKDGKVNFKYNGHAKNKYGTWRVVNGKVQF